MEAGDSHKSPGTEPPEPRDSLRLLAAVVAATAVGMGGYHVLPLLVGSLIERVQIGEEATGALGSAEMTALALVSLGLAGPLSRWSRARTALAGIALTVLGNAISAWAASYAVLFAGRMVAGIGEGLALAAGMAAFASARDPDRLFANTIIIGALLAAGLQVGIPYALEPFGPPGGFLTLIVVSLALAPLCLWLPAPHPATADEEPSLRGAPNRTAAVVVMLALFILELGQGAVWTFLERIGAQQVGMSTEAVGWTLAGTALISLPGAGIAAALGTRLGRALPIFVGVALNVVASAWLLLTHEAFVYVAMNLLWAAAFAFLLPYVMGVLAALDDLGRWTVAGTAIYTIGDAPAPWLGGKVLADGGFPAIAAMVVVTGLVATPMITAVARRLDRRTERHPAASLGA
jgi:predicted MFS family arabinose efflux permease